MFNYIQYFNLYVILFIIMLLVKSIFELNLVPGMRLRFIKGSIRFIM